MKKILCAVLLLSLLLTLPLGCGKKEAELKTVELHEVTRSVFYAPQYVALNQGYFEAEGLQVNITTSGGSDKAMTALLSGDADVCLAGPETAVYVYNAGQERRAGLHLGEPSGQDHHRRPQGRHAPHDIVLRAAAARPGAGAGRGGDRQHPVQHDGPGL